MRNRPRCGLSGAAKASRSQIRWLKSLTGGTPALRLNIRIIIRVLRPYQCGRLGNVHGLKPDAVTDLTPDSWNLESTSVCRDPRNSAHSKAKRTHLHLNYTLFCDLGVSDVEIMKKDSFEFEQFIDFFVYLAGKIISVLRCNKAQGKTITTILQIVAREINVTAAYWQAVDAMHQLGWLTTRRTRHGVTIATKNNNYSSRNSSQNRDCIVVVGSHRDTTRQMAKNRDYFITFCKFPDDTKEDNDRTGIAGEMDRN
ncbi:hypothetical protein J6590_029108 [Homalodisca vitripennis]|nr:hypothetical protein J6590_029108 [Homalodisca vitripennis]